MSDNNISFSDLRANADSIMTVRRAMAMSLGQSFDGKRDLYKACGYPAMDELTHQMFYERYIRGDIAKAVVEAFPDGCWQVDPDVWDIDRATKESAFEKEWTRYVDDVMLLSSFLEVDILAGIGQYAVLYLGFDDTADLSSRPKEGSRLIYTTAYREGNAAVAELENDTTNLRYGQPKYYQLTTEGGVGPSSTMSPSMSRVHWSRCIHVIENRVDSKVYGHARLEAVWNRLQDIDTIMGGGAEGYWRAGFPGMFFGLDKDARITPAGKADFDSQIEDYINNYSRVLRGQGITPHAISSQLQSPRGQLECELWMISATTRIPYRILTGAEQGELASSKDQDNWNTRIGARRLRYCVPHILRKTIQRLIDLKSMPMPKDGRFNTDWLSGREEKDSEKVANNSAKVSMIAAYIASGAEQMIPRETFMVDYLGITQEAAEELLKQADAVAMEQMKEAEEEYKLTTEQNPPPNQGQQGAGAAGPPKTPPQPGEPSKPPQKPGARGVIKGLRALWDAARTALGHKDEPAGVEKGDHVEAQMPNGTVVKGRVIGSDVKGNAVLYTEDKQIVVLPELLNDSEKE